MCVARRAAFSAYVTKNAANAGLRCSNTVNVGNLPDLKHRVKTYVNLNRLV